MSIDGAACIENEVLVSRVLFAFSGACGAARQLRVAWCAAPLLVQVS
jgi:hypothetical protein